MRNKKGFIFIETIITIVVLAVSLLYVYSSFNSILIKEKTRVHYDDVSYIYRTYYVKNFFAKFELNDALKILNSANPLIMIGCDYSNFTLDTEEEFNIGYNYAVNYYNTYHNLNVPYSYKIDGFELGKFIRRQQIADSKGLLASDRKTRLNNIGMVWGVVNEYQGIFGDNEAAKSICEDLVNNLSISSIAIALADLSYIQDCNPDDASASSRCSYLKNFSAEEQVYLGTLGALDTKNKYIMIIEYKEAETTERFVRNYAWVRI